MSIDYEQLKTFVKEAMFIGGGINEPSAPVGVPHRMPAADTADKEQEKGDPKANKMYDIALVAREATERCVEALDDPIFDAAYEHAFKASASLRRVLNNLIQSGAYPLAKQRVVAPPAGQQKFSSYTSYADPALGYGGEGGAVGLDSLEEGIEDFSPALREAVTSYEDLDERERGLFHTYLTGDEKQKQALK